MTAGERRSVASLAAIYALRMIGLFMILPVFVLYADQLTGHTPLLIGIAIGAYGLTQALLQIPFGMLSDRFGRKRIITIGLLLFALGSVVAASADDIYMVIAGRALQGAGAIAAAIMALVADLTREEQRTKAMATIGMSIGMSFALALVLGPMLNTYIGVPGIFWSTAVLALLAIALLHLRVPTPVHSHLHRDAEAVPAMFSSVLKNTQLLRLDFGIMILHLILTANFIAVPLALSKQLDVAHHWWVYLPVLVFSIAVMIPFIIIAERKKLMRPIFIGAVAVVAIGELLLMVGHQSLAGLVFALWVFFSAFNLLEASLPSLISKMAPAQCKGTAMGVYSSSQFMGAFLGGVLGGWVYGVWGIGGVFVLCAAAATLWVLIAWGMPNPRSTGTRMLHVGSINTHQARELAERLRLITGVTEAVVVAEDQTAYVKVDSGALDEEALDALAVARV